MKNALLLVAGWWVTGCLSGCQHDGPVKPADVFLADPVPLDSTQLLRDPTVQDSTRHWLFNFEASNNPNGYGYTASREAYASAPYSLKLGAGSSNRANHFGYVGQTLTSPKLAAGKRLRLRAKIKLENVTGPGISLAIRQDVVRNGSRQTVLFESTEGRTAIAGTHGFKEYSIEADTHPGKVDYVVVFLVYLPGTTGTVYADDISLTAH